MLPKYLRESIDEVDGAYGLTLLFSQALSRMRYVLLLLSCIAIAGAVEPAAEGADPQLASKAHAVLKENCFKCHGPDKHKGGLRLDSAEAVKKGGEDGVVVVVGEPDTSLLIKAVGWADKDTRMPPKKKLSDEQIAVLTAWVKAGAAWPEAAAPVKSP